MNNIDWDGFRYFTAAAETGSLSAAAKLLGSNQSTVGRQIDVLESALGIKLFQRSVKGLMLTEEGVYILEQAQSMQSLVTKIQRTVQGDAEEVSGTVRVALPEGLCLEVLTPSLPEFYKAWPGINLIFNVSSNVANLTRGEADIAVRLFRPTETNLVAKYLGSMSMGLFASSAYIKNRGAPSTIQALKKHHVVTYGDQLSGLEENQWLLKYAGESGRVLSSDSTITRLRATLAGVGISIQPKVFGQSNNDLIPVLENVKLPSHEVWLAYHNDLRHLGRIRAVVEFISA
ncbi:MAG: LysR family transcriptional regulator [Gammaproteobacteria bacterium]|nr:LysR family transcriptional regulator [Gammaproteobacteria bacterium]